MKKRTSLAGVSSAAADGDACNQGLAIHLDVPSNHSTGGVHISFMVPLCRMLEAGIVDYG